MSSKLSPALKSLINAPFSRPGAVPAPANIRSLFEHIAKDAEAKKVGVPVWTAIAAATTFTLNSPDTLSTLYSTVAPSASLGPVPTALLIREIGLKCIGFNGVPRTINMLGAFRGSLPPDILSQLPTKHTRVPDPANITATSDRGFALWKSIYRPFDVKLYDKLAESHPDLPVHILHSEYGALFSDPQEGHGGIKEGTVGRVLTSLCAVSCLRAQTGVGPQVLSHVFGLRKAFEDGTAEGEDEVQGGKWLAGDEGGEWVLNTVDSIVEAVGASYAQGYKRDGKL